jgi:hypothetical protein
MRLALDLLGRAAMSDAPSCEAGGGIEGKIRRHRAKMLRVQWQVMLYPLNEVCHQHPGSAEDQQSDRILSPGLLLGRINATETIRPSLKSPQEPWPRPFLPFKYPQQVPPERPGHSQND